MLFNGLVLRSSLSVPLRVIRRVDKFLNVRRKCLISAMPTSIICLRFRSSFWAPSRGATTVVPPARAGRMRNRARAAETCHKT